MTAIISQHCVFGFFFYNHSVNYYLKCIYNEVVARDNIFCPIGMLSNSVIKKVLYSPLLV